MKKISVRFEQEKTIDGIEIVIRADKRDEQINALIESLTRKEPVRLTVLDSDHCQSVIEEKDDERCSRCHVVFTAGEVHDLKETAVLSNVGGYEIYNGEVSIDCTKCSYHEDQLCSHVGTGRVDYVPAKKTYQGDTMIFTHKSHCERSAISG